MQSEVEVKRNVVVVMDVSTVVSKVGDIDEADICIILIPGNPGIIEFYDVFLMELYQLFGSRIPLIGVAQAGHSPVWEYAKDTLYDQYLDLPAQIQHKVEFVRHHIPKDKRLIFLGHSIGSYISLKMMEEPDIENRVAHMVHIFPAIERLSYTPNGQFWCPVSKYLRLPFAFLALCLSLTPHWFKDILVAWRAKGRPVNKSLMKACHSCVSFSLMNNALYMAASEMDHVLDLDDNLANIIQRLSDRSTFYYGPEDKWSPIDFFHEMKARFPDSDIRLCTNGYPHDFVLDASPQMAATVWKILTEYIEL